MLPGLQAWLNEFWELSTERALGTGPGPIPSSAIQRAADRLGVYDLGVFRAAIRAMDGAYLDHVGTPQKDRDVVSGHDMSTELFDAVFG